MQDQKRIIIIAGPNGAGKTTFAMQYLPHEAGLKVFINADLIARGLSPLDPTVADVAAGRLMLQMIDQCVEKGESFAFETTLSGLGLARAIPRWRKAGYDVIIAFIRLDSPGTSILRVRHRVAQADMASRKVQSAEDSYGAGRTSTGSTAA